MAFSKIYSAQNHLLKAHLISVELDISKGSLHAFSIVGLPDKAVEEARDRVSAAIKNSGFKSPKQTNAKIVVSLAPADIKKEGPAFDVPIALGYLLAAQEIEFDPHNKMFVGELALDGSLRPVRAVVSYARLASSLGFTELFVPYENATEASLITTITVYGVKHLREVIHHLENKHQLTSSVLSSIQTDVDIKSPPKDRTYLDDVVGQEAAKRGLIIAASGGHNIALFGPPGTGKTMLARALNTILPPLSYNDMLEVTELYSTAGCLKGDVVTHPPFRSPHHTSSHTALIGGGPLPRPGEVTLAHRGVLFLDEFPEFNKNVIESLRQPLEDRYISITRTKGSVLFPADFILVAALNPCPCGNRGIAGKTCTCAPLDIARYARKLSGPIMDRIDIWIEVSKIDHKRLAHNSQSCVETIKAQEIIQKAKYYQQARCNRYQIPPCSNAALSTRQLSQVSNLSPKAEAALNTGAAVYDLSARGYHRLIKVARTIADIEGSESIDPRHIMEALQYRQKLFKKD